MAISLIAASPAAGAANAAGSAATSGQAASGGFADLIAQLLASLDAPANMAKPVSQPANAATDSPANSGPADSPAATPDALLEASDPASRLAGTLPAEFAAEQPEGRALAREAAGKKAPARDTHESGADTAAVLATLHVPVLARDQLLPAESTRARSEAGAIPLAVLEHSASGSAEIAAAHAEASANPAGSPSNQTDFSTLLQAAQQHQTSATGATQSGGAAGTGVLQTPLYQAGWANEFGERIVWMAKNDQQHAQLTLNPAHLGPVQIALSLEANQASAHFSAATPEARQAIEDALPRLREMFADAGIALGQAQVGTQARGDSGPAWENPSSPATPRASNDPTILAAAAGSPLAHAAVRRGSGLVDLFA